MPGRDWVCDECGHNNFARRKTCQNCDDNGGGWKERDEDRPDEGWKERDDNRQKNNVDREYWKCDDCGDMHRSDTYLKCPHAKSRVVIRGPRAPQEKPPITRKEGWQDGKKNDDRKKKDSWKKDDSL